MNRTKRAGLASETLEILDAGRYAVPGGGRVDISERLKDGLAGTRQFDPEELRSIRDEALSRPDPSVETKIEVVNETTLAGIFHLCGLSAAGRVGALNFASAKNPGGGFLGGSQAQEESLARSSGLYKSLLQCPEYYSFHRSQHDALYSHRAIYSPGCPVFRNDAGELLAKPCVVDFFTCPAPNAGAVRRNQPKETDRIVPVLRERATLVLGLALHFQVTDMVLGAWGCGVFKNDPKSVAEAFRDALCEDGPFAGRFRTVRFSVLDRSRDAATLTAFGEAFKTG